MLASVSRVTSKSCSFATGSNSTLAMLLWCFVANSAYSSIMVSFVAPGDGNSCSMRRSKWRKGSSAAENATVLGSSSTSRSSAFLATNSVRSPCAFNSKILRTISRNSLRFVKSTGSSLRRAQRARGSKEAIKRERPGLMKACCLWRGVFSSPFRLL
ncbi:uncharacterized protein J3D65DRAFT_610174, partial [Phyllosticta citribraziliensis]